MPSRFGVYPDDEGETVLHIRSRARAGSRSRWVAFLAAGEAMQTRSWTGFIDRVAAAVAEGVRGAIHVETREMEEVEEDCRTEDVPPTFLAVDEATGS